MDDSDGSVSEKVLEIIGRYAGVERTLQPADRLADLNIDSIGLMELIFDLEETFDIHIEINANWVEEVDESWRDVGSAIETVSRLVRARGTSC